MDPKGDYIHINSIDDIDPGSITIRDLNKRYIDRSGNRYATRFNLQNRKVEIVQIVKGMHEAQRIKQQRAVDRTRPETEPARPGQGSLPAPEPENEEDDTFGEAVDTEEAVPPPGMDQVAPFIEQQFIDEVEADFERIKQRQQGIINNFKNSGLFAGERDEKLTTMVRQMEAEAWPKCENAINYSKELRSYPRPVSYYATKLSAENKTRLDAQPDDPKKLALIRRWELQRSFEDAYLAVRRAAESAKELLGAMTPETYERLGGQQKQHVDDAGSSLSYMLDEITGKLQKIEQWRHRYGG